MIDPHIWEDPGFNGLSLQARLLFIGMISNADDEGYFRGDAGSLKRLVFGFDDLPKDDVEKWLEEISKLPTIHFFEKNNEAFGHFTKWGTYQKQKKNRIQASVYPRCGRCRASVGQVETEVKLREVKLSKEELLQKISNRLTLSKGQLMAFAKEFNGLTTTELKEQQIKCNTYMNMSSQNYSNPGLFFKGWLKKYMQDKKTKESEIKMKKGIESTLPVVSEEERQRNFVKITEIRKNLSSKLGVNK